MDRRARRFAGFLAVAALLATGCEETPGQVAAADPLDLVPANAAAYWEVTLDPSGSQESALGALERRLPEEARAELRKGLRSGFNQSFEVYGWDVADFESWVGDRAGLFVVTEVVNDFEVLLFPVEDSSAEPLEAFEKTLANKVEDSYRGVDYVTGVTDGGPTVEIGLVDGVLVIAQEDGFAATVDASASDSLGTVPEFRQAMGPLPDDALARFYVDVDSMLNEPTLEDQITREEFRAAGIYGNGVVGVTLSARDDAVVVDATSGFDRLGHLAPVVRGFEREDELGDLPGGVWFAARIPRMKAVVRAVMKLTGAQQQRGWQRFQRDLARGGLRFRRDFVSWMRDATVYVGGRGLGSIDAGIVIESSDPRRTRSLVRALSVLLRGGGARVSRLPSFATDDDFDLHVPELPQPIHVSGARAFAVTYGRPLNQAYREDGFLDDAEDFAGARDALDPDYGVTLFADVDQARAFIEGTVEATAGLPKVYVEEVRPFLEQGDYVIHGVAVDDDRILQQLVIGVR